VDKKKVMTLWVKLNYLIYKYMKSIENGKKPKSNWIYKKKKPKKLKKILKKSKKIFKKAMKKLMNYNNLIQTLKVKLNNYNN
jgi:hypothetical protein